MSPFLTIFLLSLTSIAFLLSSTTASPPLHESHFSKHLRNYTAPLPQEYIEVTRPLPFSSLKPSCSRHILSHSFGYTYNLPPTNATYSPPSNCTWSRAVLHLSGSSNGSQYDRIAAVWLDGAEILRTSTPEPTADGIFWNVRKDITKYSSILRQHNLTLSVMLENLVNDVYTGVYRLNLTMLYYYDTANATTINSQKSNPIKNLKKSNSSELNENPADLIVPISAIGDEGFWFRIEHESDSVLQGIKIPLNTYRAVIEVYASYHGNDEFWYSNPPDSYIDMNNLSTKRGHGSYREVVVKLDDNIVGSVIPFPVIFTGGINPLFWEPVVSIGAFSLPSYEFELTPFLGMLLDGKVHYFGLGVESAISFWLVDANLHLWLDPNSTRVQAQGIEYDLPSTCVEREYEFHQLDGEFQIEAKRKSKYSGWVNSSFGNFTTYISDNLKYENKIKLKNNGTEKVVKQKVKLSNEVRIESNTGVLISSSSMERKYPLEMKSVSLPGSAKDSYLMTTELEHSITEEKTEGLYASVLENSQKSNGWMFVQDHDVLSGAAITEQSLSVKDSFGCYSRSVSASNGSITNDSASLLCTSAL